jgi:hypothetical protein
MANFEKRRVAFLGMRSDPILGQTVQLVTMPMMVRPIAAAQEGGPPRYEGPVFAAWENIKHSYPGLFDDLHLYGAVVALLPGHSGQLQYVGQIDWVQPTDAPLIRELEDDVIDGEYEVVKH